MSVLSSQVARAQRRLWLFRWCRTLGWSAVGAACGFALVVLVVRGFGLAAPLGWIAAGLGAAGLIASVVWCGLTREDAPTAAAMLDENAGLKERISSGLYVAAPRDAFERAVRDDAERISASLTVRQHIRFHWPESLGYGLGTVALAGLLFWLMPTYDLLGREQERVEQEQAKRKLAEARQRVLKPIDRLKQNAKTNRQLRDALALQKPDELASSPIDEPADLKRAAFKKLDQIADALRAKRNSAKQGAAAQMKAMLKDLRGLKMADSPVGKLSRALAKGNFREAAQALKHLQAKLAQAKASGNQAEIKTMRKELAALAAKLNQLAQANKRAKRALKQAGLTDEQIKKMLQNAAKMNQNQLQQALRKMMPQMNNEQLAKLARKLAQNQGAAKQAQALGQNLQKMAQAMGGADGLEKGAGQMAMAAAGDQLSEAEMLEQEMQELQAALSQIQAGMNQLNGLPRGGQPNRPGSGMGRLGQGRGNVAPEQKTARAFKIDKNPGKMVPGQIIGQRFVDGEQFKGEATAKYIEAIEAAQAEATDALANDRIPRQYQGAVREYFKSMEASVRRPSPAAKPE